MSDKSEKKLQLEARFYRNQYINWLNKSLIIVFLIILDYIIYPDRWWVHWVIIVFLIIGCYNWIKKIVRTRIFNQQWEKDYINKRLNNYDEHA